MQKLICILCIVIFEVTCGSSPTSSVTRAVLVFTNWVPDTNVSNGPEPGYKPVFTGLTVLSAYADVDQAGLSWVINVTFTSSDLFSKLTRDHVAACPGDPTTDPSANCAQRHLAIWLNLTQTDIDNWGDPTYAAKVSQPYDLRCVAHITETAVCPKFVTNPVTLEKIDGGQFAITGKFTKQSAKDLADAINSA